MTPYHQPPKTGVFAKFWEMRIGWTGLFSGSNFREQKTHQCALRFRCHPANEHEASLACFGKFIAVCLCSDLIDADKKRDIVDRILSALKGQVTPVEST